MMKTKTLIVQGAVAALLAGTVLGHGFPSGFNGGASSGTPGFGSGRTTGNSAPNAGSGGNTPNPRGGATNPRGTGGSTRGGGRRGESPEYQGDPTAKGGAGGGEAGAPVAPPTAAEIIALRTKEFAAQMVLQAAALTDRTTTLDVQAADLSLKPITFRVRVTELREKTVARRLEVMRKDGEKWVADETFIVKSEATGRNSVWRKDAAGKVTESAQSLADIKVQGSSVSVADLIPFDASAYDCTLEKPAAKEGEARETYLVKTKGSGTVTARATFDPTANRVVHVDWLAGGVRLRASDWSGWRVTGGVQMPSRVTILGGGLEPLALVDIVEARINTKPDAALVDPLRLKS